MADIELVIKIHEEEFAKAKEDSKHHILDRVWDAVAHGTPLPEGHGDLIDRKNLLRLESKWYHLRNGDMACPKIDIEHAPTIIEADNAESEVQE